MRTTEVNKCNFHKHQRGAPGSIPLTGGTAQVKIHKYTNVQMHKYKNVQMHKYTNTQLYKCINTNIKAESTRLHTIDKRGLWVQNSFSNWASTYKVVQRILHLKIIIAWISGLVIMRCCVCDLSQWGIKLPKTTWQNYLIDWLILEVLGQHGRPLT